MKFLLSAVIGGRVGKTKLSGSSEILSDSLGTGTMKVFVCAMLVVSSLFLTATPVFASSPAGQNAKTGGQVAARETPRPNHRRNSSAGERKQRLSAEERRALRRDIKSADHQIYRPKH